LDGYIQNHERDRFQDFRARSGRNPLLRVRSRPLSGASARLIRMLSAALNPRPRCGVAKPSFHAWHTRLMVKASDPEQEKGLTLRRMPVKNLHMEHAATTYLPIARRLASSAALRASGSGAPGCLQSENPRGLASERKPSRSRGIIQALFCRPPPSAVISGAARVLAGIPKGRPQDLAMASIRPT
jgi:hypothetical protein